MQPFLDPKSLSVVGQPHDNFYFNKSITLASRILVSFDESLRIPQLSSASSPNSRCCCFDAAIPLSSSCKAFSHCHRFTAGDTDHIHSSNTATTNTTTSPCLHVSSTCPPLATTTTTASFISSLYRNFPPGNPHRYSPFSVTSRSLFLSSLDPLDVPNEIHGNDSKWTDAVNSIFSEGAALACVRLDACDERSIILSQHVRKTTQELEAQLSVPGGKQWQPIVRKPPQYLASTIPLVADDSPDVDPRHPIDDRVTAVTPYVPDGMSNLHHGSPTLPMEETRDPSQALRLSTLEQWESYHVHRSALSFIFLRLLDGLAVELHRSVIETSDLLSAVCRCLQLLRSTTACCAHGLLEQVPSAVTSPPVIPASPRRMGDVDSTSVTKDEEQEVCTPLCPTTEDRASKHDESLSLNHDGGDRNDHPNTRHHTQHDPTDALTPSGTASYSTSTSPSSRLSSTPYGLSSREEALMTPTGYDAELNVESCRDTLTYNMIGSYRMKTDRMIDSLSPYTPPITRVDDDGPLIESPPKAAAAAEGHYRRALGSDTRKGLWVPKKHEETVRRSFVEDPTSKPIREMGPLMEPPRDAEAEGQKIFSGALTLKDASNDEQSLRNPSMRETRKVEKTTMKRTINDHGEQALVSEVQELEYQYKNFGEQVLDGLLKRSQSVKDQLSTAAQGWTTFKSVWSVGDIQSSTGLDPWLLENEFINDVYRCREQQGQYLRFMVESLEDLMELERLRKSCMASGQKQLDPVTMLRLSQSLEEAQTKGQIHGVLLRGYRHMEIPALVSTDTTALVLQLLQSMTRDTRPSADNSVPCLEKSVSGLDDSVPSSPTTVVHVPSSPQDDDSQSIVSDATATFERRLRLPAFPLVGTDQTSVKRDASIKGPTARPSSSPMETLHDTPLSSRPTCLNSDDRVECCSPRWILQEGRIVPTVTGCQSSSSPSPFSSSSAEVLWGTLPLISKSITTREKSCRQTASPALLSRHRTEENVLFDGPTFTPEKCRNQATASALVLDADEEEKKEKGLAHVEGDPDNSVSEETPCSTTSQSPQTPLAPLNCRCVRSLLPLNDSIKPHYAPIPFLTPTSSTQTTPSTVATLSDNLETTPSPKTIATFKGHGIARRFFSVNGQEEWLEMQDNFNTGTCHNDSATDVLQRVSSSQGNANNHIECLSGADKEFSSEFKPTRQLVRKEKRPDGQTLFSELLLWMSREQLREEQTTRVESDGRLTSDEETQSILPPRLQGANRFPGVHLIDQAVTLVFTPVCLRSTLLLQGDVLFKQGPLAVEELAEGALSVHNTVQWQRARAVVSINYFIHIFKNVALEQKSSGEGWEPRSSLLFPMALNQLLWTSSLKDLEVIPVLPRQLGSSYKWIVQLRSGGQRRLFHSSTHGLQSSASEQQQQQYCVLSTPSDVEHEKWTSTLIHLMNL